MWIEKVHPQEEGIRAAILLKPSDGGSSRLCGESVSFVLVISIGPAMCVHECMILKRWSDACFLKRHNRFNRIVQVQQWLVPFLSTMLKCGIKSVMKAGVEQVRAVADQLRNVSHLAEQLRNMV